MCIIQQINLNNLDSNPGKNLGTFNIEIGPPFQVQNITTAYDRSTCALLCSCNYLMCVRKFIIYWYLCVCTRVCVCVCVCEYVFSLHEYIHSMQFLTDEQNQT